MKHIFDGILSLLAALATIAICGVPAWFTFFAIQAGDAPVWVYAPLFGLIAVGLLMTLAFLRKTFDGVSPSRQRRRR